jgi:putative copper resistance protein D
VSFLSIILTARTFVETFNIEFIDAFFQVLYGTDVGKGWIGMLAINTILLGLISYGNIRNRHFSAYAAMVLVAGLAGCYARARHVSILDPVGGGLSQLAHVLGVVVWLGLLVMFAYFSTERVNWKKVLTWFKPLSILCMMVIIVSGIAVMFVVSSDYVNSWVLPYSQALLVKHLLMIPLLLIAFLNGFLYRVKIRKETDSDPRSWLKAVCHAYD